MVEQDDIALRCRRVIEDLSQREAWNLTRFQVELYLGQILQLVSDEALVTHLEQVVRYFHEDHQLVAALRDERCREHQTSWAWLDYEIIRVAKFYRLDWSSDRSIENDDLIQIVRVEVARSLEKYRYESSLRTWLQQVTLRRLRRLHRDNGANKRALRPQRIEEVEEESIPWADLEPEADARLLLAEIERVLSSNHDKRLAAIFFMSVIEDWSSTEIGQELQLHPSRIRALLKNTREMLCRDRSLQHWHRQAEDTGFDNTRAGS